MLINTKIELKRIKILDGKIEELKNMEKQKKEKFLNFLNKCMDYLLSEELNKAIKADVNFKEENVNKLKVFVCETIIGIKSETKEIEDLLTVWELIQKLCKELNFTNNEYVVLGDIAEELNNYL